MKDLKKGGADKTEAPTTSIKKNVKKAIIKGAAKEDKIVDD
jgi:hypothetical protein